jgi:hypothetical protein
MSWIKRNLFFVIGSVIALGLLAWAGFYNFSRWKVNAAWREKLNGQYVELKRLNNLNPHPGNSKVDNIAAAREQRNTLTNFITRVAKQFQPIAPIPPPERLTSRDFAAALRQTIDQLQRDADSTSVALPPQYSFSFYVERKMLNFAPGSLEPLSVQLGEVKAICDVLNNAKVNSLDGIRRERVCVEDMSAEAQPTDYLEIHSKSNELAVTTPYEVSFRCFTPELAEVIAGFANSPNGLVVKSVNVDPALSAGATESTPDPAVYTRAPVPQYYPQPGNPPPGRNIRGSGFRGGDFPIPPRPAPAPVPVTAAQAANRGGPQPFINEKQIRVVMVVDVVKLLPKK